mgnify:CR=1 FL=1
MGKGKKRQNRLFPEEEILVYSVMVINGAITLYLVDITFGKERNDKMDYSRMVS